MAFQDAPKGFYGFSFIPHVGFSFPSVECVGLLAADCRCKTCRRKLGRHFLPVSATSFSNGWKAAGRVQLRGGREKKGRKKN